ncbi:superinfection exclusion [Gordonia phage Brandonk123]|uniref:Lipoprotein n=1 Tax=Gordonia phage Brandonk123 TaxID=2079564 RepID=A0A2L0HJH0_9CAUD|nr:superinfection exclusion [Gordonia phage Brandonk123]AUX81849.1 lipoprotein [Gordonia phage Brandonk123]
MKTRTKILGGVAGALLALGVVGGIAGAGDEATVKGNDVQAAVVIPSTTAPAHTTVELTDPPIVETTTEAPVVETVDTPSVTVSQTQALQSAEQYLAYVGGFSRAELIDQLVYEDFSRADAEWAVDNVTVDWFEQAEKSAADYIEFVGGFSYQELVDQLVYEQFTQEQAEHGAKSVDLTP